MTKETRIALGMAQQYCDDNDKSTEFMLQYMQDEANVDLDCVLDFLMTKSFTMLQDYTLMDDFRKVLSKIKNYIDTQDGIAENQLKTLWNELSEAITKHEEREQ